MARKKLKWSDMRPRKKRSCDLPDRPDPEMAVCRFHVYLYPLSGGLHSAGLLQDQRRIDIGRKFLAGELAVQQLCLCFPEIDFGKYFLNSVVLALLTVVFTLITSSMAAYVISRRDFVGKKLISTAYLLSMFISVGSVALYPLYTLMSRLGLTKNMVGLALMLTGGQAANIL